ncbi:MAG: hypothetical protein E3J43_04580 [Candidatus Heimdallarchaeota archaeon]|nr:MAG: hypothetical protein E3J43_04580 [Candidatus Heimdallarchaeota archaeon]
MSDKKLNLIFVLQKHVSFKIGFLVNPIAGIGGKKGWKGTDLIEDAWEYFEGGEKYSFERVKKALSSLSSSLPLTFYYCDNPMGAEILEEYPFEKILIYTPSKDRTAAQDTQKACQIFLENEVDLILFVGGDGTARDVASVIADKIPTLGIPSGVKMFSGCFLYHPQDLGEIMVDLVADELVITAEDVMDVNEALFRENKVHATLFGHLMVPQKTGLIQGGKISSSVTSVETYEVMALELKEEHSINDGIVVLGTGSTIYHVMKAMNIEKTLLGVDLFEDGKIVNRDISEATLYELTKGKDISIILTPIGGQGFLLGRGNQQISSRVLLNAKSFKFVILSSEQKLETIEQLELDLDSPIDIPDIRNGYVKVLIAYHQYKLTKINVQNND